MYLEKEKIVLDNLGYIHPEGHPEKPVTWRNYRGKKVGWYEVRPNGLTFVVKDLKCDRSGRLYILVKGVKKSMQDIVGKHPSVFVVNSTNLTRIG